MLVLTRKASDKIVIDDNIMIEVIEVQGNRVRLGIQAPRGVAIWRQELFLEQSSDIPMIEQASAQLAVAY